MKPTFGKLELIVFTCGAVVMILELICSRIMAPFLGSSIFVWTSIIGVVLGSLSLGYYIGGRLSTKEPNLAFLCKAIFAASLLVLAIAYVKEPVLEFSASIGVKAGSLFASVVLLVLPSVILGIISPYAIRLKIKDIEHSGGVAGNLYALSTIGSIIGTFASGFLLIPFFGSTQILFGLSLALAMLSLLGGKKLYKIAGVAIIIFSWWVFVSTPSQYLLEKDSAYNHIRVGDYVERSSGREVRVLFLATEMHSIFYKDGGETASRYHLGYRLDNLFTGEITKGLTLGGGAYISPKDFRQRFPDATMEVVEIDPEVTATAIDYFSYVPDDRTSIFHEDGRIFLNNATSTYDVIYGDAFSSYFSIPFHLTTREAVRTIYEALDEDGIYVLNVISSLEGEKSDFFKAEYKTISQYFPNIYVFPIHPDQPEMAQNIVLIASKQTQRFNLDELAQKADPQQRQTLQNIWHSDEIFSEATPILTDEYAPVENMIAKFL